MNTTTTNNQDTRFDLQAFDSWDAIPGTVMVQYSASRSDTIQRSQNTGIEGLSLQPIEAPAMEKMEQYGRQANTFVSLLPHTYLGQFNPAERTRILDELSRDPEVIAIEPDRLRIRTETWGTTTPNDPDLGTLWGMERIGAPSAWAQQPTERASIRVAVSEDEFDALHEDLFAQASAFDYGSGMITSHATHVAGTIAATGNNSTDVVGVANVELVSLDTGWNSSDFISSISWAVNVGIDVINMSWHWCGSDGQPNPCDRCVYTSPSVFEQASITNAANGDAGLGRPIFFVASAGNEACAMDPAGNLPHPAAYIDVHAVSAINESDDLANFSNFGLFVDFAAPGVNILSTELNHSVGVKDGTSMAAPHVSGTAAAILAVRPSFFNQNDTESLPRLMRLTADDLGPAGRDDSFGNGVVRVDRAIAGLADYYAENNLVHCSLSGNTLATPSCFFDTAVNNISSGQTLGLVRNSSFNEQLTITKPMTIISVGGPATVGE